MATSWLRDCILNSGGSKPPLATLKHTGKTRGWSWRHSRVQVCCCVNWSRTLVLLMENPHVRLDR